MDCGREYDDFFAKMRSDLGEVGVRVISGCNDMCALLQFADGTPHVLENSEGLIKQMIFDWIGQMFFWRPADLQKPTLFHVGGLIKIPVNPLRRDEFIKMCRLNFVGHATLETTFNVNTRRNDGYHGILHVDSECGW